MKRIRKVVSILLIISMVICNAGVSTFANSLYGEKMVSESKIEEQLIEDLGEEKVESKINSQEELEIGKFSYASDEDNFNISAEGKERVELEKKNEESNDEEEEVEEFVEPEEDLEYKDEEYDEDIKNVEIVDNIIGEVFEEDEQTNESVETAKTEESKQDEEILADGREESNSELKKDSDSIVEKKNSELKDEITIQNEKNLYDILEDLSTTSTVTKIEKNVYDILENLSTTSTVTKDEYVIEATANEITLFGDVINASDSEVKEINYGYRPPDVIFPQMDRGIYSKLFGDATSLPSSYDARTKLNPANTSMSVVPPIRNQGPYGTCWAHAVIGMIETSIRTKGLVDNENDSNLSEAALAYFYYHLDSIYGDSANMDKPGLEGHDYVKIVNESTNPDDSDGNHWAQSGGNELQSTLTMSAYVGAIIENDDTKYENMSGPSGIALNGLDGKYAYNNDAFVVNNVQYINKNDRDLIKKAIMDNGSVGISYKEDHLSFNKVGDEYYFYSVNTGTNHAVMVVGWDDNIPASNFTNNGHTPSSNGGWLVRNSWGNSTNPTSHLKDGYFWMSYEETSMYDNVCSIDAIKADTYKYNYHYDTTGYTGSYTLDTGKRSIGNIYKVTGDGDQMLQAVSAVFGSTNVGFSIDVYTKNSPMDNPKDGTKVTNTSQNFTTTTAGIYTVPLDNPIKLSKDTYFSIVIKLNSGTGDKVKCYFDKEELSWDPKAEYHNECNPKESFIGYDDYPGYWYDINEVSGNFRIKAFTNDAIDIGFNANGGEGNMATQSTVAGTTTVLNANTFTRTGYVFTGWNTVADGSGDDYADGDSISSTTSITLYAQWTPIHYTLKLNPNGQTGTETSVEYDYDQEVSLANPGFTSLTHSFDGWTTDSTGSGTYYSEGQTGVKNLTTTDGDTIILYAKWIPGAFKVKFNGNGATSGNMDLQSIIRDVDTALNQNIYLRTGYTFSKWTKNADGSGAEYADMATVRNLANKDEEYEIYANWIPITYTIKYNANNGSVTPTQETKTYDENITLATPSRVGYTFEGWYKESDLINVYNGTTDLSSTQGAIANIYAKWSENSYTLKLNPNFIAIDGTGVGTEISETLTYTQSKTLANTFTSEKYNFVKWNTNADGTGTDYSLNQNVSMLSTTNDAIVTLYAQWQAGTYTIKFDGNGSTSGSMSNQLMICDALSNLNNNSFVKTGYNFIGWATSSTTDVVYTDGQNVNNLKYKNQEITLYAKWTPIHYTLKLNPNPSGQNGAGTITGTEQSYVLTYDEIATLSNPSFESTTDTFGGWSESAGKSAKKYSEDQEVSKLATTEGAEVILYAYWVPGAYKVAFDGNGATSGSMGNQTITVGQSATLLRIVM